VRSRRRTVRRSSTHGTRVRREFQRAARHSELRFAGVSLPAHYAERFARCPRALGVLANWFGGSTFRTHFFPQFAIDAPTYLDMYPEYLLPADGGRRFSSTAKRNRRRKLAEQYGWKVGDQIRCAHDLFREWTFTCAVSTRAPTRTDQSRCSFIGIAERDDQEDLSAPGRPDRVFIVSCADPAEAAEVSAAIDAMFKNSLAETLTETEKAFQLSFVAMTEAIFARDSSRVLRRHRDHHGRDCEHDGDDGARAGRRVCER